MSSLDQHVDRTRIGMTGCQKCQAKNARIMLVRSQNKSNSDSRLFAVWDPDVLYLSGMLQKPAAFGKFWIEPVDGSALVRPDLFQIAHGHGFSGSGAGRVAKGPDGVDIIVLRQ